MADRVALTQAVALALDGHWEKAHAIVQQDEVDPLSCWIHAVLHKIEGDEANARYWYARAGRNFAARGELAEELDRFEAEGLTGRPDDAHVLRNLVELLNAHVLQLDEVECRSPVLHLIATLLRPRRPVASAAGTVFGNALLTAVCSSCGVRSSGFGRLRRPRFAVRGRRLSGRGRGFVRLGIGRPSVSRFGFGRARFLVAVLGSRGQCGGGGGRARFAGGSRFARFRRLSFRRFRLAVVASLRLGLSLWLLSGRVYAGGCC